MKKILLILTAVLLLCACADNKTFTKKSGEQITVEPYGLLNKNEKYNSNTTYKLCVPNVVLDVVFSETIVVPAILISTQLYEPVAYNDTI